MNWTHIGPTVLASFMASLVEFVEALTVILAIGVVRGWRCALVGTAAALLVLLFLVVFFGQSLAQIPLRIIQLVVGALLLMFSLRWLRKAILRSAGVVARHDETKIYIKETSLMRRQLLHEQGFWDKLAFTTAFKIVMLEGIEVVFIVIAIGSSGQMILPASIGAIAAFLLVALLGICLHRPLAGIPENALKFGVGVVLAAFGTFWVGEAVHLEWPSGDWTVIGLISAYFLLAQLLVIICRTRAKLLAPLQIKSCVAASKNILRTSLDKLTGLFVDDVSLASGVVAWVLIARLSMGQTQLTMSAECGIFFCGFASLLAYSAMRATATETAKTAT
jgi:uncharacterized membrane protein